MAHEVINTVVISGRISSNVFLNSSKPDGRETQSVAEFELSHQRQHFQVIYGSTSQKLEELSIKKEDHVIIKGILKDTMGDVFILAHEVEKV